MKLFAKLTTGLMLAALLGVTSLPALAGNSTTFKLDPNHTQVRVSWSHAGFSNPGATFDIEKGTLVWNADDPEQSSVSVTIPANSLDTQVPALDAKLESDAFFDVGKYPTITFESTDVERIGLSDHFRITGKLTIHGITKPATLHATLNKVGEHPKIGRASCRERTETADGAVTVNERRNK